MNENSDAFLDEDEGIIELEDEDGNITRFEFVDKAELNGVVYYALIPEGSDDEDTAEFVVLKEIKSGDDEAMLSTIDDDDEYTAAGEMFIKRFSEMIGGDDFDEESDGKD